MHTSAMRSPRSVTSGCEGVVYYLRDGRVRGVLIWNARAMWTLRGLIAQPRPFRAADLMGRLPSQ